VTATGTVSSPGSNATLLVSVSCPTGHLALGGGGIINGATAAQQVSLTRSIPSGNPATGWSVQAEQTNTGTTVWTLVAEVVCT
jgi:hypothetical protein